jgi:predicted ATPase
MSVTSTFLQRVVLRNYKSIGACDVELGALTFLVGANGSGKSNFLDALHFVRDALTGTLDNALQERGGLVEVRRRSSGHPTNFGIRLELRLPDARVARYSFTVGALAERGYEVQREECVIGRKGTGPYFRLDKGRVIETSESTTPNVTGDRLALVSMSGLTSFRPVYDALTSMGFYNLNPRVMRDPQKPQDGRTLKSLGENISSVIGHLERTAPERLSIIEDYLRTVVPAVNGIERKQIGPVETLEFRQEMSGAKYPWRFPAQNMSDGTMRALGVLTALFQSNTEFPPLLVAIEEPETALHPAASSALREALEQASTHTQVLVTSHSPDLLNDHSITADHLLSVVSEQGETKIARLDQAARQSMRDHLFSAGELLRLNQLEPDRASIALQSRQADLFADSLES